MGYYSRNYHSSSGSGCTLVIAIILMLVIIFGFNSCSAPTWNDGICPKCEVRYELRGVSRGAKYYSCPECGQEVSRY